MRCIHNACVYKGKWQINTFASSPARRCYEFVIVILFHFIFNFISAGLY